MAGDFLHGSDHLSSGDVVELDCDTQCNFMLMTDAAFSSYRSGREFKYYGGFFKRFPARIAAPHSGHWNWVIDLGGGSANIRYSVRILK